MKQIFFLLSITSILFISCAKDPHNKPQLSFRTGGNHIFKDTTLAPNTAVVIGCDVKKVEDDLKTFNFSVGYDGGNPTTRDSHNMSSSEINSYSKDENITTRNQAGKEVYQFTVSDQDANISTIQLTVTVK